MSFNKIDSQIQQEMDRKQKEKLDNIESENRWIASITGINKLPNYL